jgi:hypothetical protein
LQKAPLNAGKPWHAEEDKKLKEDFKKGCSIEQLERNHRRTKGAIVSRLEELGLLPPGFLMPRPI